LSHSANYTGMDFITFTGEHVYTPGTSKFWCGFLWVDEQVCARFLAYTVGLRDCSDFQPAGFSDCILVLRA